MPASLIIDRFYSYVKSQQIEKFFGPDMFWVLSKKILYPHWVESWVQGLGSSLQGLTASSPTIPFTLTL